MYRHSNKSAYTVYNPHTDISNRDWSKLRTIRVVSIDPGRSNFCIRVEDRPLVSGNIVPIIYERVTFSNSKDETQDTIYSDLSRYLLSKHDILSQAHVVIIERQLPVNYPLVRISQHILTWFMEYLRDKPNLAVILEVSGDLKKKAYQLTKMTKAEAKKWAATNVPLIFQRRGDTQSLQIINNSKKKDDLGDVVLQVEAVCDMMGWYCDK